MTYKCKVINNIIDCFFRTNIYDFFCFLISPDELFMRIAQDILEEISTGTKTTYFQNLYKPSVEETLTKSEHFIKQELVKIDYLV